MRTKRLYRATIFLNNMRNKSSNATMRYAVKTVKKLDFFSAKFIILFYFV